MPRMCNFCATARCLAKFRPSKTYGKGAQWFPNSGVDNHKLWQLVSILGCNKVKTFKQDLNMKCCFMMRQRTPQLCRGWGDGLRKQAVLLHFSLVLYIWSTLSFLSTIDCFLSGTTVSHHIERYLTEVDDRCLGLDCLSTRMFVQLIVNIVNANSTK